VGGKGGYLPLVLHLASEVGFCLCKCRRWDTRFVDRTCYVGGGSCCVDSFQFPCIMGVLSLCCTIEAFVPFVKAEAIYATENTVYIFISN
jgi:hypothetical protein